MAFLSHPKGKQWECSSMARKKSLLDISAPLDGHHQVVTTGKGLPLVTSPSQASQPPLAAGPQPPSLLKLVPRARLVLWS